MIEIPKISDKLGPSRGPGYIWVCRACYAEPSQESTIGGLFAVCAFCDQKKPRGEMRHILFRHLPSSLQQALGASS